MKTETIPIIHSCPVWLPQTQTWMYTQARNIPEKFLVHIVCDRKQNIAQFDLDNIWCLREASSIGYFGEKSIRKLIYPKFRIYLARKARELNAQLIHSHYGSNGWFDQYAVKKAGAKHIVTYYGYDVNGLPFEDKRWLTRYQELFASVDAILCEGPFMAEQIARFGCPAQKLHVHHLGIPTESLPFVRRTFKKGDALKVLIAATFNEKKGIPYALEALGALRKTVPLEITIIGDSTSTPSSKEEKKRILDIVEKSNLKQNIRFLGFQPYYVLISEAYKHHIFLSPSVTASNGDTEGGAPVSIIEMVASGMPVVSTKHCDIPEVVHYGLDDWLVEERDVEGLSAKIRWLMDHPDAWDELLVNGRHHIESEFDAKKQGERLGDIYSEILGK